MAGVEGSSGITIPSEVSALLLTVVILGVCVAAVVADLVGGPEQPATTSARHHRDYGGPWKNWLAALQGSLTRTGQRILRGLEVIGTAIEKAVRAAIVSGQSWASAARASWVGLRAQRKALKERHAAHARHVVHIDEVTQPADTPEPYPLPPPLHEWEEHEKQLRKQQEEAVELLPRRAVRLPDTPPASDPPVQWATTLRDRPTRVPSRTRPRRGAPERRPGKAHLPAPPRATRVRSALLLVVLMSALGAVVTAVILSVLLLVVKALSGV